MIQNELLIAVLGGLGAMCGWGFADFSAKKTVDQVGEIVSLAWGHIVGTAILFLVVLYQFGVHGQQVAMPNNIQTWLLLIFFGALQAAVYFFVYKGFGKGQVGLLSPLFASFAGLVAIFSIVILGEAVNRYVLFGLAILFVGVLLINLDVQALRSRHLSFVRVPGFKEIGIATLMAVVWTLSWDKFVSGKDWLVFTFYMYMSMTLAILAVALIKRIDLFVVKPYLWKFLILIGLGETVAYVALSLGYSVTSFTSVVALLSGAFSLPTIILARVFLKERITTVQTIGSVIIILGIMFLTVL